MNPLPTSKTTIIHSIKTTHKNLFNPFQIRAKKNIFRFKSDLSVTNQPKGGENKMFLTNSESLSVCIR